MCRKQAKRWTDWQEKQKQKGAAEEHRRVENEHRQKSTCAANKAGGTLSETNKHYQQIQHGMSGGRLNTAGKLWFRSEGGHVRAEASASLCWHLINRLVSMCHCFLPSSWPLNIRSKRRRSHYHNMSARQRLQGVTQRWTELWWGGMTLHLAIVYKYIKTEKRM